MCLCKYCRSGKSRKMFCYNYVIPLSIDSNIVVIGSGSNSRPHENCGITDNPAYETYTGELGVDRLEHDYNMDNNPLYIMTNKPTTKTQLYETVS